MIRNATVEDVAEATICADTTLRRVDRLVNFCAPIEIWVESALAKVAVHPIQVPGTPP